MPLYPRDGSKLAQLPYKEPKLKRAQTESLSCNGYPKRLKLSVSGLIKKAHNGVAIINLIRGDRAIAW